jgi:flagellar assembly protein FliH
MAGIIKTATSNEPGGGGALRAYQFDDVGQSYLARVRSEATRIVAEARQEAAKIKAKAVEDGRQAAIAAAQASLRSRLDQQLTDCLAALKKAAENITAARHAWQQHWEKHTVQLAAAIAARLCRRELSRQPDITLQWVHEALELAAANAEIVLRLCPTDHDALANHVETIKKQLTGLGAVRIVADPAISAGGCRVDTQFGSLDQQVESQLARISQELLN